MANSPTLRPEPDREADYRRFVRIRRECPDARPLLNRATAGLRAGLDVQDRHRAAALESGKYTMETRKTDPATAWSTASA
jgi:hypothetical protein